MKKIGISASCNNGGIGSLDSQLDHFISMKVDSVEIPLFDTDVIVGKKIIGSELDDLKKILSNRNLDYTIHGELSVNLLDEKYFEDHKEVLKKDIEVSGEVGATHLVTHFGQTTNSIYEDTNKYNDLLKKQDDCYLELSELAKSSNVVLAIENLFPFETDMYAPLPSEIANHLKKLNHPFVKSCLDISHAYINCTYRNVHFINEIKTMAPLSEHIHMHDSFGILQEMPTYNFSEASSYGLGDLHLPLGWGSIPFDKVFEELKLPENINLNFELPPRYSKYWHQNIKQARDILQKKYRHRN